MNLIQLMKRENFLWVEKYRPHKIEDCILPNSIKNTYQEFVDKGEIPNLLLSGPAGTGKTTIAKALCLELGVDYYVINGSDEGRFLDTVRNQAKNFASTVSLQGNGKPKVIIIDEADNTTNDVQLLLRANIETFHANCRFIFTCNFKNKSSNHSIPDVPFLTLLSKEEKELLLHRLSSKRFLRSLAEKGSSAIKKYSQKLYKSISQTFGER